MAGPSTTLDRPNFRSDSLCVLVTEASASSIATSLLFNHSLSIAASTGCTTMVRPEELATLPLRLFDSPQQPPVQLVRKIEFVYLPDRSDFVDYIARLYELDAIPACFVVESLERYSTDSISGIASLLALLHNLGLWIKEKRTIPDQADRLAPVVCAICVDRSEQEKTLYIAERYASSVWRLHEADEEGKFVYYRQGETNRLRLMINKNENQIVSLD